MESAQSLNIIAHTKARLIKACLMEKALLYFKTAVIIVGAMIRGCEKVLE